MDYSIGSDKLILAYKMTVKHQMSFFNQIKVNKEIKNLKFQPSQKPNHPNYHNTVQVKLNDFEIGHLFLNIKLPYNRTNILFQFTNLLHYQAGYDFLGFSRQLEEHLGIKLNNINRLEICYDTVLDLYSEYLALIQEEGQKKRNVKSFRTKFAYNVADNKFERTIRGGTSYSKIHIYNKSSEIPSSNKSYIMDYWETKGFIPGKSEVTRFEVSIGSEYFRKRHRGVKPEEILSSLPNILNDFINRQLRVSDGKKTYSFLDIDISNKPMMDKTMDTSGIHTYHYNSTQNFTTNTSVLKGAIHTYLQLGNDESKKLIYYVIEQTDISYQLISTTLNQHQGSGKIVEERKRYLISLIEHENHIKSLKNRFNQENIDF